MRPTVYSADALADILRSRTVATRPQLASAFGGASRATVARKLKQIGHISSYSHRGKFYALPECAQFDPLGLWCHDDRVRFSSHGTLRATALALVDASDAGFRPAQLDALLGVSNGDTLASLVRNDKLARVKLHGRTLYCSAEHALNGVEDSRGRTPRHVRVSWPRSCATRPFPRRCAVCSTACACRPAGPSAAGVPSCAPPVEAGPRAPGDPRVALRQRGQLGAGPSMRPSSRCWRP